MDRIIRYIISVVLILAPIISGAVQRDYTTESPFDSIERSYSRIPVSELRSMGSKCISELRADSALAFYTIAASRYNEGLTKKEKEDCAVCTINTGYVWLYMLNNAEQAYPWIIKGMEICEEEGFDRYLPIASNYLAQIHATYGDTDKALSLYRKAFRESLENEIWWSLLMSYTDLLTFAWQIDSLDKIGEEMEAFERTEIPRMPLSRFSESFHEGMKAIIAKDYPRAERLFVKAESENDAESGREHGDVQNKIIIGDVCFRGGDVGSAIDIMRNAERLMRKYEFWDLSPSIYNCLERYYSVSGRRDSSEYFHIKGLEIHDSIFNVEKYGKIKDLETAGIISSYDNDLRRLSAERDNQRRNAWMFGAIAILIATIFILTLIKNKKLSAANRELYLKNLEILGRADKERKRAVESPAQESQQSEEQSLPASPEPPKENREMMELMVRVTEVFDNNPEIYDPDFSIDRLAELTESLPRYVSQAVNEAGRTDFRTLLATYRVREACRRLSEEAHDKRVTVEAISTEVGYRSRTHFSKVFKEITGLTPSEFLRQAKKS